MTDAETVMHAISRDHRLSENCVDCQPLTGLHARLAAATVRPPGDEAGLRAAAQAVLAEWDQTIADGGLVTIALDEPIEELRAALAAKPDQEEPELDVERLATAICAHREPLVDATPDMFTDDECRMWARRVVTEYVRLANPDTGS